MMAKESEGLVRDISPLDSLIVSLRARDGDVAQSLPPVHLWDPPFCGDIDMRIARDGTWFYGGTPIGRPALVRLFASVLRKDGDRHVLVTPVERVGIAVEDAPFVAVEMALRGAEIGLRTNVGDWVTVDEAHPLRFEPGPSGGLKPYVLVRGGLWALVARPVFYELVEACETRDLEGVPTFGAASGDSFFAMMPAEDLERLSELSLD